ncbi:hypothetical protein AAZX31_14G138600 [Glycine max]
MWLLRKPSFFSCSSCLRFAPLLGALVAAGLLLTNFSALVRWCSFLLLNEEEPSGNHVISFKLFMVCN